MEHVQTAHASQPAVTTVNQRSRNSGIIIAVIVLVAIAGGFVGGMQYQKSHGTTGSQNGMMASANGQMGGPGGRSMNGSMGSVTAVSASSISVSDQRSGSTKTYAITSSTKISDNGSTATYSDISVGDSVLVSAGSSTSTDATQILINPSMNGGPGGPGMQSSQSSSSSSTTQTQTN